MCSKSINTVSCVEDVNIQSLLDYTHDNAVAVIVQGSNTSVFIRQEFLNLFNQQDKVKVGHENLHPEWGQQKTTIYQEGFSIKTTFSCLGTVIIKDWRGTVYDTNIDTIIEKIEAAKEYTRRLTFTTYEVK